MVLRLRSLKTRTALALSSVIVAILVFNGVYMILTKQEELRKGIEQDAVSFARLTRVPIASAFLSAAIHSVGKPLAIDGNTRFENTSLMKRIFSRGR